jgi:hypothetical protein
MNPFDFNAQSLKGSRKIVRCGRPDGRVTGSSKHAANGKPVESSAKSCRCLHFRSLRAEIRLFARREIAGA